MEEKGPCHSPASLFVCFETNHDLETNWLEIPLDEQYLCDPLSLITQRPKPLKNLDIRCSANSTAI